MKKQLFLVLMLICSISVLATNYYVKTAGNDSNTGLSDAQAWATINKVNGFTFDSGDSILFKGGDVWLSTYPTSGGLYSRLSPSVGNIVIGSYGAGQAEITGLNELIGWTVSANWSLYATGIYRIALANNVNRLWINGKDSYRCQTLTLTSGSPWRWESGYLYLKSSSNPATFFTSLKSGSEQERVVGIGQDGITLTNLNISGGNTCIFVYSASDVTIKGCTIGNRVNYNGINVWTDNAGDSVKNVLIHDNIFITGDSLTYSYAKAPHSTGDAVQLGNGCTGVKVYDNVFERWSHASVYMIALNASFPFHGNEVYENFVTSPIIDYARAFGADTHSGSYNNSFHDNTAYNMSVGNQLNSNGLKFYNNIIDGIRAVPYTTNAGYGVGLSGYASNATNMEVYGNTIKNCINVGIAIDWFTGQTYQKAYNNIHDNNIFNNGTVAFHGISGLQMWITPNGSSINHNTFTNNHFFNLATTDVIYYGGVLLTVGEFNSATPLYNDTKTTNDALLKVGSLTTDTSNNIYVIHNSTSEVSSVTNPYTSKDSLGNSYPLSVTLQPYSSKVLIKYINPITLTKQFGQGKKQWKF